jgi:glutathione S-transferase
MSWIVFLSKLLSPNFKELAKKNNSIQVVTIGISHYCELAIWCLKAKGIPYQEYACAPVQHVFPSLAVRVGDKQKHLSKSSRTTEVELPNLSAEEAAAKAAKEAKKDNSARATAVPVAVCPQGEVWTDSWDIAAKTGLVDIEPSLKKILDEKVGVLARQYAYSFILQPRNNNIWNKLLTYKTGFLWSFLWWAFLGSYTKKIMVKTMKPYNADAVADCRAKLEASLKELDSVIASKKTPFLGGASIGVADIAVASLVGPLVNPPLYCGGKYTPVFEELMQQDAELKKEVERVRASVTGAYVMELYAKYR